MQAPWIGPLYNEAENVLSGKKLLVVGESHHHSKVPVGTCVPSITVDTVRDYQEGATIPYFTRIATMVLGAPAWENGSKSRTLWDSLAFYNYVPVIAASYAREFDWSLWSLGTDEFNQVLDITQPDLIVVTGYRLWDNAYIRHTDGAVAGGQRINMSARTVQGDRKIPTLIIRHPSAPGFSGLQQHPEFQRMLDSAGTVVP